MKLQVYRVDRRGNLIPIGAPKQQDHICRLYDVNISYQDAKQLRLGILVRKYDNAGTIMFLRGVAQTCSPSTTHKAASSTQATAIH